MKRYDARSLPLVIARVPLFPLERALELLDAEDPISETLAFYRREASARLAVSIASPTFGQALESWTKSGVPPNDRVPLRALAYALRMSTRATPFGLFAAAADVATPDAASGTLAIEDLRGTQTRIDATILRTLVERAERSETRKQLRYRTNPCAVVQGPRIYVTDVSRGITRSGTQPSQQRTEQREISLKHTDAVAFVRDFCRDGATYANVTAAMQRRFGADPDICAKTFDRLIEGSVVFSELRIAPFDDPAPRIADILDRADSADGAALRELLDGIAAYDATPISARGSSDVRALHDRGCALAGDAGAITLATLSTTRLSGAIGTAVLDSLGQVAELLVRAGRSPQLDRYAERFSARYEGEERLVPLLELVDDNLGLGIPDTTSFAESDGGPRYEKLAALAFEAIRTGRPEIDVEEHLDAFAPALDAKARIARSLEIGFSLAGDRIVVRFASESALNSVARFLPALSEETRRRAAEILERGCESGEGLVEFAYMTPDARSFNVTIRPDLAPYRLLAGFGEEPTARDIDPSELLVGLDGNAFFIYSPSLGQRLSLRETHALRTANSAPNLCRFITLTQAQGTRLPYLYLGAQAEAAAYTPRLRYRNVVLAPRTWRLQGERFGTNGREAYAELVRLRALWDLPRYVFLCDHDNRLLLDCQAPVSGDLIDRHMAGGRVVLEEALEVTEGAIPGAGGTYAPEFVAQLLCAEPAVSPRREIEVVGTRENYAPGSEWSYVKLYIPQPATDAFLSRDVAPFVLDLISQRIADRWFFVRYDDRGHHVRLRIHAASPGASEALNLRVLRQARSWHDAGAISRFAHETYEPEYERYGGLERTRMAERFFHIDSEACVESLRSGLATSPERIEAAASIFNVISAAGAPARQLVLDYYAQIARESMDAGDRDIVRRLRESTTRDYDGSPLLAQLLQGSGAAARLSAIVHMHCNRLGLDRSDERRAGRILRAATLATSAVQNHPVRERL